MELNLPVAVTSKKDVIRLRREIERILEGMLQKRVAKEKSDVERDVPKPGKVLDIVLEENKLEINEEDLAKLDLALEDAYNNGPQVRMSFASEPDQESLEKFAGWFRKKVNPRVFIQVGIQPSLAGGCIVRTPKKRYDFSLTTALKKHEAKLQEAIVNVGR